MSLASLLGAPRARTETPPGDQPPKPAPDQPDKKPRRRGRGPGAQARYFAELFTQQQQLLATMSDMVAAFSGRQPVNKVLQVRTVTFPASGVFPLDFHTRVGAVQVSNLAAAAATASPAVQAPANPAAGADITYTVPAGVTQQLQTVEFTLTTSATVANRQIILIIDDGTHELWRIIVPVTQAASLTYVYAFGGTTNDAAVRTVGANNEVLSELPAITLAAGYRIRTSTVNLQAGDQFSAIAIGVLQASTTGHTITVTSTPASDAAPSAGIGVAVVPAGQTHIINLASHTFTLYGTAGDQVLVQAFTAGAPPQAA